MHLHASHSAAYLKVQAGMRATMAATVLGRASTSDMTPQTAPVTAIEAAAARLAIEKASVAAAGTSQTSAKDSQMKSEAV